MVNVDGDDGGFDFADKAVADVGEAAMTHEVSIYVLVDSRQWDQAFGQHRFGGLTQGGFLAQKFNRRTIVEPITKLSYEALLPPLRQAAVTCRFSFCRPIFCLWFTKNFKLPVSVFVWSFQVKLCNNVLRYR